MIMIQKIKEAFKGDYAIINVFGVILWTIVISMMVL